MTSSLANRLGRTMVLVPHPDDETIGCGGLLALLARNAMPVHVVLMSDGTGSHRRSTSYPAGRLRAVRQAEMVAALRALGHSPACLTALNLPDGAIPSWGEPGFGKTVARLGRITGRFAPDTVVMPLWDDGHPDHRATHAIGTAACAGAARDARQLGYPVWGGSLDGAALQLDIGAVLDSKRQALACHRSQQGLLIDDDPQGFVLPMDLLARCALPVETYLDMTHGGLHG